MHVTDDTYVFQSFQDFYLSHNFVTRVLQSKQMKTIPQLVKIAYLRYWWLFGKSEHLDLQNAYHLVLSSNCEFFLLYYFYSNFLTRTFFKSQFYLSTSSSEMRSTRF